MTHYIIYTNPTEVFVCISDTCGTSGTNLLITVTQLNSDRNSQIKQ